MTGARATSTSNEHSNGPIVGWAWEDGQLHGGTVDGTTRVTANLHRAQWTWGTCTLVAERTDDQVQLRLAKASTRKHHAGVVQAVVGEADMCWTTQATTPLRALNSPTTKERLSTLPLADAVSEIAYFVVKQAVKFFENPRLLSHREG